MQDPASLYVCGYCSVAYSISTDSAESEVVEEGAAIYLLQRTFSYLRLLWSNCGALNY